MRRITQPEDAAPEEASQEEAAHSGESRKGLNNLSKVSAKHTTKGSDRTREENYKRYTSYLRSGEDATWT